MSEETKAPWIDLISDGRALLSTVVVLGVALHALQIQVIIIIMPTVVADIGGAAYFTWSAMIYSIGTILGTASTGPLWAALGARNGHLLSGFLFLLATTVCALAPGMATLIAARALQGYGGGLLLGGSMVLVSGLFPAGLRTRILACYQGTWMVAQLLGPVLGGAFAEIGWWRGSFWAMVPLTVILMVLAWLKIPLRLESETAKGETGRFPLGRLSILSAGLMCFAAAGPVAGNGARALLILAALALLAQAFRLDRNAENRLFPIEATSLRSPVGLALWILFAVGTAQAALTVFLPLLLQVVHGVTPLFISFVTIIISAGWTVGTFGVAGWTGNRERFALWVGPLLMFAGQAGIALTAQAPLLWIMTLAAFLLGVGIGTHNVHLLARTMAAARAGEERITSSAMPSFRSLGSAFGAALAGMLANLAGLGDATEAKAVGDAVTFVYGFNLIPLGFAAVFMFWLLTHDRRQLAGGIS